MNRREFLNRAAAGAAALVAASGVGAETVKKGKGRRLAGEQKPASGALPARLGTYYEAEVPDTLDLAERARLGLNHFTSIISEERDYEMHWYGDPLGMSFVFHAPLNCQPKALEAMAFLRLMSGSQQNLEREAKMVERMAAHLGDDDGLYWMPWNRDMPHDAIESEDPNLTYCSAHGNVRMMRAMIAWYQYTGDPAWKGRIDRMVDGFDRVLAVHKDGYAYIPTHGWIDQEYWRSCYVKGKGWKDVTEPPSEKGAIEEGSLFNHQGPVPGALANWYVLTGNREALRLSGEIVRFLTKPQFWADWRGGEYPGVIGAEHAHWQGHWHGYINVLRAILEYAIATNDARLKQFVRDGYEWARQPWFARFGMVSDGQGCGIGRLIGLAVKLSYAGVGDYWEDVDLYIRNHGSEQQFTPEDIPFLRKLAAAHSVSDASQTAEHAKSAKPAIEGMIGGFNSNPAKASWALCCSPHGNMGLFYAWDGTLRYADGVAHVNLLLNRASPWMDVDSYLPYEGKVVLKNKACQEAYVRIPLWVEKRSVGCRIGGRAVRSEWFGRYLRFEHLKAGDVVSIEFPIEERMEQWTSPGQLWGWWPGHPPGTVFTFRFRGNTLIEITPSPTQGSPTPDGSRWWPYQARAEKYHQNVAPMRQITRFATPIVLRW